MYISRDMRSNPFPPIIVLNVMRDMRVSCYKRCNPNTSPPVNYVLGVVRVMPVLRVVRLCPFSRYHRCFYSVLCLMHVMQDMHVMSPNHFLLKTMSYTHQVLNVCKLR